MRDEDTDPRAEEARAYLRKRGFSDRQVDLLRANAPKLPELRQARAYLGEHKRALKAHKRVLRAARELLEALQAPEVSAFARKVDADGNLSEQEVRRPDHIEALLEGEIMSFEYQIESLKTLTMYQPIKGLERAEDMLLFAAVLDRKLRMIRLHTPGAALFPNRDLTPKEMLAVFTIIYPNKNADEDAMKKALARARKKK